LFKSIFSVYTQGKNVPNINGAEPSPEQQKLAIRESLNRPVQHYSAGDLSKAESIYREILQAGPNQPEVLNLLGVIAHKAGKANIAFNLIKKTLDISLYFCKTELLLSGLLYATIP
jgi:predicted Zn-dependent protease